MKQLLILLKPHRTAFVLALAALVVSALFTAGMTATIKPLLEQILAPVPQSPGENFHEDSREASRGDRLFAYQERLMAHFSGWLADLGLEPGKLGLAQGGLDLNNPLPWCLLVLLLFLGQAIFDFWGTFTMGRIGLRVVVSLRQALFEKVLRLPMAALRHHSSGDLLSRMNNDVGRIQVAISVKMGELCKEMAIALAAFFALFIISWQLSLALFLVVPLVALPILLFSRRIRKHAQRSQSFLGTLSSHFKEVIVGMNIVRAFGREAYEADRLQKENDRFLHFAIRELRHVALTTPVIGLVGILIIMGFISLGSFLIQTTRMTLGDFMVFVLFVYQLYQPIKRIARANSEIQQAVGVLPRIREILDLSEEVADPPQPRRPPHFPGMERLAYREVGFFYEDGTPVLEDISFEVSRGEMVALVGPSGGGKTTLAQLLPRFYEVESGSIAIDEVDIRHMKKADLRQMIGMVTQDTVLFNDTVHHNIAYGLLAMSRAQVEEAARQASAHDFITALPHGYDTVIGEAGVRLSGGQKQRLSIARALLKNPPLLILDEATSALDTESERMVQSALEHLMNDRTSLVIAHRLSTVRQASLILFLANGRIVERGTHASLMEQGSHYRRWVALQEGATHADEHDRIR